MDIIAKIVLALKKKKEDIVLDLLIKDYEHCNYYIALVFNKKINKFRILFVPIDLIDKNDKVFDYFCYQFIYLNQVEYILKIMNENEEYYKDININKKTINFDSYYIELNYYNCTNDRYSFKFSQFIDKEFLFLFDVIAVIFEYLPNIVSELCIKLLQDFDDNNISIKYNYCFDLDIYNDSYKRYFNYNDYNYNNIDFIERVGNRFYVIYNGSLIVVDYIRGKGIVNICSNYMQFGIEHFNVLNAIKDGFVKEFYKVIINDYIYLCYGVKLEYILLIGKDNILIDNYNDYKFINYDDKLVCSINNYLVNKYSYDEVEKINNIIYEK